ncbi:hypothetical protein GGI04_000313 [Coemansia thaxteri]|nr:hypothetical protein GGI04_000313 [Coemansia thaxteri]KAJ2472997.1 hypothetical protein GGI02_001195 [Coemansia sp. RSA 2322]
MVVIESPEDVQAKILPVHFHTDKYSSFTRQFHIYGFKRKTDGRKEKRLQGYCLFLHPDFRRNRFDRLGNIKRKAIIKDKFNEKLEYKSGAVLMGHL